MEPIDSAFPEFQAADLQSKMWGDRLLTPLCGLLAFLFYALLTPHCLPSGVPAELTATALGLPAQTPSFHLLWRSLATLVAHIPLGTMTIKLALLSAICSAIAASLVYQVLVELMMHRLIPHGTHLDRLKMRAVQIGGVVGALAFAVAAPVALAATRASLRSLDCLLVLIPIWLFLRYFDGGKVLYLLLAGMACGLGMGENPACYGTFVAVLLCGIIFLWRQNRTTLPMLAFAGLALVLMLLVYPGCCYLRHLPGGDLSQLLQQHVSDFRQDYMASRTAMLICVLSLLPLLLALATMNQTLNYGEDYESLLTLSTLAAASLLVLTNAFSSFRNYALLSPEPTVLPYLFAAMTAGFVAASWWTIALCHNPEGEKDEEERYQAGTPHVIRGFGYGLAIAITTGMLFSGFLTATALQGRPDNYPQLCAESILQDLGPRHWLFGSTPVDTHLAVLAHDHHIPLQIVPLTADENPSPRKRQRIANALAHDAILDGLNRKQLAEALSMGPDVLLRTWLLIDPKASDKLVIAGSPLLWAACGFTPVPALFFFGGSTDSCSLSIDFADRMLHAEQLRQRAESSRLIDGTMVGVIASAGQMLSDSAAYASSVYRRTGATNDAAMLATYWDTPQAPLDRRTRFSSPLAWVWETTILPGRPERADILHAICEDARLAALDQKDDSSAMRRAATMTGHPPHGAENFAELYARAANSADMGRINQTFSWLAQLDQCSAPPAQLLILRAEANLALAGGVDQAISLLQDATTKFPHDLWAWHLLVAAHLQRGKVDQAEHELLPIMESLVGKSTNDMIRLTRAIVLCARGGAAQRTARDLFVEVSDANPNLLVAREWALRLDVLLNDTVATSRDADILVSYDANHAQANYVLAGLAMQTHQIAEADRRFRQSLTGAMTPQAMVGWAQLDCQQHKYAEALQLARKATVDYPAYPDGWLVLGDVLEATGKPGEAAVVRSHATPAP